MRKIYQSNKDIARERFVRAVLHHKYKLELTSSLCPYDFIGDEKFPERLNNGVEYNAIYELKARTYRMADVPDGKLFLTFDKYQKIAQTLVPFKKLIIMNPEGLWIGDFKDICERYHGYPDLIIGGRYDRNDTGDVGLHVLFPVDKLQNIYTREELITLQHEYNKETTEVFSAEEIQRLLANANSSGGNEA